MLANYQVRVLLNFRGSLNVYTPSGYRILLRLGGYRLAHCSGTSKRSYSGLETHASSRPLVNAPSQICVHCQGGTSYNAGSQLALTTSLTFNIYKARPRRLSDDTDLAISSRVLSTLSALSYSNSLNTVNKTAGTFSSAIFRRKCQLSADHPLKVQVLCSTTVMYTICGDTKRSLMSLMLSTCEPQVLSILV